MATLSTSSPAALQQIIEEYDSLGVHRTGTAGDNQTTEWLLARLSALGVEAHAHAFTFPLLDVHTAEVEVQGRRLKGHAQMDAGLTAPRGVTGLLKPIGAAEPGCIAVLDQVVRGGGHDLAPSVEHALAASAAALILVARHSHGSMVLTNAPNLSWPWPLPVLLVPAADAASLLTATQGQNVTATVRVHGTRRVAQATNVVAYLPASPSDETAAPFGLLTPKSGWYTCAAERGGGIAVWLQTLAALAELPRRPRPVMAVASSGHELGHCGLEAYLLDESERTVRVGMWLQLGASIGAAVNPVTNVFASDAELQAQLAACLEAEGVSGFRLQQPGFVAGGESRNISLRGERVAAIAGGHAFFHTPEDRPDKVDVAALGRYCAGVSRFASEWVTRG
jgi:hypothetical protein